MATPVQFFIDAGYARSTANDPNLLALVGELVAQVHLVVQELYTRAKQVNPLYFLESATVAPDGTGWTRPTLALDVLRVERLTDQVEVHVVPMNDRLQAALPPRVYRTAWNRYRTVGQTDDPSEAALPAGTQLVFWYAATHAPIVSAGQVLDASWPERHNDLVSLEVARYLSLKDKARGDLEALDAEIDRAYALFDADLGQVDAALEARFRRVAGYRPTAGEETAA